MKISVSLVVVIVSILAIAVPIHALEWGFADVLTSKVTTCFCDSSSPPTERASTAKPWTQVIPSADLGPLSTSSANLGPLSTSSANLGPLSTSSANLEPQSTASTKPLELTQPIQDPADQQVIGKLDSKPLLDPQLLMDRLSNQTKIFGKLVREYQARPAPLREPDSVIDIKIATQDLDRMIARSGTELDCPFGLFHQECKTVMKARETHDEFMETLASDTASWYWQELSGITGLNSSQRIKWDNIRAETDHCVEESEAFFKVKMTLINTAELRHNETILLESWENLRDLASELYTELECSEQHHGRVCTYIQRLLGKSVKSVKDFEYVASGPDHKDPGMSDWWRWTSSILLIIGGWKVFYLLREWTIAIFYWGGRE